MHGSRTRRVKSGGRPRVQPLGNDIEQEAYEQPGARTAKRPVNQYPPVPCLPLEKGLNQPSADSSRKNASEEPALQQERPDARCRAATAYRNEYGRGDDTHPKKNSGHHTCDQTNRDADTDQDQHDDEDDQSQEFHEGRMIRSNQIATVLRRPNRTSRHFSRSSNDLHHTGIREATISW